MKLKKLPDILALATKLDERALNKELLLALKMGAMSDSLFLEYLAITQGDVVDCLTQALE